MSQAEPFDVRALMADIEAEVDRKLASGAYPPELLAALASRSDGLTVALETLRDMAARMSWDPPVESHRPGVGRLITFAKRVIRKGLRWHTVFLVGQMRAFGSNTATSYALLAEALQRLESEMLKERARLRAELATLRREQPGRLPDTGPAPVSAAARSTEMESFLDYAEFEDAFRGDSRELRARQRQYLRHFEGVPGTVADLGCGRGEFLALLKEAGLAAYGVDRNAQMVQRCEAAGLQAREQDLIEHLEEVREGSLGGIFSAQVVEHLEPAALVRFFQLAHRALRPGGRLVVETLNPRSLAIFTNALYVDLGHVRPQHPLTLEYLARAVGFVDIRVDYTSPLPPASHLDQLPAAEGALAEQTETLNRNFRRLDEVLFGPQDFALLATR